MFPPVFLPGKIGVLWIFMVCCAIFMVCSLYLSSSSSFIFTCNVTHFCGRCEGRYIHAMCITGWCSSHTSNYSATWGPKAQTRYGSIPINTIFRGMNIHLPAILMFTRGTRF